MANMPALSLSVNLLLKPLTLSTNLCGFPSFSAISVVFAAPPCITTMSFMCASSPARAPASSATLPPIFTTVIPIIFT
ncbi:Uncharacterised protein [Candidatus Burarchaeum australiense]|nr:Uncharacterised protein [Candidatus Burarchaeum australiense]